MTTAAKTNHESFLAISKTIVGDAIKNGTSMARLRALRGYMREVLDTATKDNCNSLKASIVGEMFSTHDGASAAIIAFAKEKVKFTGTTCAEAMVAIEKEKGIYSPTAEVWVHVAKKLNENKIKDKDYGDLWRQCRAELRSVADKANGQMNEILEENKVKEKPTGKKGGRGGKSKGEVVEGTVVVSAETDPNLLLQNLSSQMSDMSVEQLMVVATTLIATLDKKGLSADQVDTILFGAIDSVRKPVAAPVAA